MKLTNWNDCVTTMTKFILENNRFKSYAQNVFLEGWSRFVLPVNMLFADRWSTKHKFIHIHPNAIEKDQKLNFLAYKKVCWNNAKPRLNHLCVCRLQMVYAIQQCERFECIRMHEIWMWITLRIRREMKTISRKMFFKNSSKNSRRAHSYKWNRLLHHKPHFNFFFFSTSVCHTILSILLPHENHLKLISWFK